MTTTETTQEVTTTENPFRLCKTGKFEYPAEDEKCPDWEKCVLGNEDEFAFDLLGKGMKPFKSPEERNNKYSGLGIGFHWSANQKARYTLVQFQKTPYRSTGNLHYQT